FLSEASIKNLIFDSEPNATLQTLGKTITEQEWNAATTLREPNTGWVDPSTIPYDNARLENNTTTGKDQFFLVKKGETVIAKYSNLENSSYAGTKLGGVEYALTLTELSGPNDYVALQLFSDPTVTTYTHTWDTTSVYRSAFNWHVDVKFYDENGNIVSPSSEDPTIITFASINSKDGLGEYVKNFSGDFVSINGSAITAAGNKATNYSSQEIEAKAKEQGSTDGTWDDVNSPYAYVGAIGGKATSNISFDFGNTEGFAYWFAFNTKTSV
ncbi:TPA: GbpC/Spa domain-containing protein, partial [Streptococcus suis]